MAFKVKCKTVYWEQRTIKTNQQEEHRGLRYGKGVVPVVSATWTHEV